MHEPRDPPLEVALCLFHSERERERKITTNQHRINYHVTILSSLLLTSFSSSSCSFNLLRSSACFIRFKTIASKSSSVVSVAAARFTLWLLKVLLVLDSLPLYNTNNSCVEMRLLTNLRWHLFLDLTTWTSSRFYHDPPEIFTLFLHWIPWKSTFFPEILTYPGVFPTVFTLPPVIFHYDIFNRVLLIFFFWKAHCLLLYSIIVIDVWKILHNVFPNHFKDLSVFFMYCDEHFNAT